MSLPELGLLTLFAIMMAVGTAGVWKLGDHLAERLPGERGLLLIAYVIVTVSMFVLALLGGLATLFLALNLLTGVLTWV